MRTVSVTALRASLGKILDQVRQGHEIMITNRGRPVARLVPVEGLHGNQRRLEKLVHRGILSPPRKPRKRLLVPPAGRTSVGALAALLEERTRGR